MEQSNSVNQLPNESVIQKPNSFLITLLSILLLISCLIAGFFAWQTQKLVKELTAYRLQPTATQTPTPTPDPTAGWKTYTNEEYKFSFKYPQKYTINDPSLPQTGLVRLYENGTGAESYDLIIDVWKNKKEIPNNYLVYDSVIFEKNNMFYTLLDNNNTPGIDDIIKTFKFIEAQTSSSPTACTEEAKLCPDGSSVSRIGPNCEFAPCP